MANMSLAVKYRPQSFDDLTEQGAVKTVLINQVETKTFQHAYLFTGSAGTGKTTSARIFANMINENKGNPIEIDGASNSGVDNIRTIIEDAKKKPLDADYKIYIIDECHALSNGAWQCMLKLLEEPPKYTIFILCTTNPEKIPDTIISRVQSFKFNKLSTEGICSRINKISKNEFINIESDCIDYIAKRSKGGMRDAITMLDTVRNSTKGKITIDDVCNVLGMENYDVMFDLLSDLLNNNEGAVDIISDIYNEGKSLSVFLSHFMSFVLDIENYMALGNINTTNLPNTEHIKNECERIKNIQAKNSIYNIMNFLLHLNNDIKYSDDMLTLFNMNILVYCLNK